MRGCDLPGIAKKRALRAIPRNWRNSTLLAASPESTQENEPLKESWAGVNSIYPIPLNKALSLNPHHPSRMSCAVLLLNSLDTPCTISPANGPCPALGNIVSHLNDYSHLIIHADASDYQQPPKARVFHHVPLKPKIPWWLLFAGLPNKQRWKTASLLVEMEVWGGKLERLREGIGPSKGFQLRSSRRKKEIWREGEREERGEAEMRVEEKEEGERWGRREATEEKEERRECSQQEGKIRFPGLPTPGTISLPCMGPWIIWTCLLSLFFGIFFSQNSLFICVIAYML